MSFCSKVIQQAAATRNASLSSSKYTRSCSQKNVSVALSRSRFTQNMHRYKISSKMSPQLPLPQRSASFILSNIVHDMIQVNIPGSALAFAYKITTPLYTFQSRRPIRLPARLSARLPASQLSRSPASRELYNQYLHRNGSECRRVTGRTRRRLGQMLLNGSTFR